MKKIITTCAGLLLMLSFAISAAGQHGTSALEEAATHGQMRHTDIATEHAKAAVKHIQAGNNSNY
jgi:hypothetical protein